MQHKLLLLSGITATIVPQLAFAQTPAPQAAETPAQETTGGIADIVVTAQKRSESIQSTPLAISALNSEMIKERGITSTGELSSLAPSLSIISAPAAATDVAVYIRGIGEIDTIMTADSPIGLYVDGIILGRSAGAAFDILDLERIEVLRGPQGTLYGRNTLGGAINLIAKKPGKDFGADINFSAGNYGFLQWKGSVDTGVIGDSGLSARFTYLHKQRNGYVNAIDVPSKRDPGAYELDAFRAAVHFEHDALTLDYSFDHSKRKSAPAAFQLTFLRPDVAEYLSHSPELGGPEVMISEKRLDRLRLNQGMVRDKVTGHTLNAELELGDITLRSLTGFRKWGSTSTNGDLGGTTGVLGFQVSPAILAPPYPFNPIGVQEVNLFDAKDIRRQRQFSQEFNVLGKIGNRFQFVLGAYYFKERSYEENPQDILLVLPSPSPIPLTPSLSVNSFGVPISVGLTYKHYNRSKALFAQGTYSLTDTLKLTGGVRYTMDNKHLIQTLPGPARDLKGSFKRFNYAATLDWQAAPNILLYARTASAYKAGGFSARAVSSEGYKPEDLTSYEIGMKSDLLDRRLRLNLTAYYASHKDLQVTQLIAGSGGANSQTVNAGKARYWGIEGEIVAKPIEAITLGGNIGYVNRKYKEFIITDPVTDLPIDVSKTAKFSVSAALTASAYAQWNIGEFSFGSLSARMDYDYRGKIYFNPNKASSPFRDELAAPPRHLVGARVSWTDIKFGGAVGEVSLWGKNIFNSHYRAYGIDFGSLGFAGTTYGEPATYGIDLTVRM